MSTVPDLHGAIAADLEEAGKVSPYRADADEPDPRYKSYGVRADSKKRIIRDHRSSIRALGPAEQRDLARLLIESEYGEQQSVALFILEPHSSYFTPDKFGELDHFVRCLHGWSKIDSFTGTLLRDVLFEHPNEFLELVGLWNKDPDLWLRRASVVLFTRKVARSGRFNDEALGFCEALIDDAEPLVQKGIGWALKDLMRSDKDRIIEYVVELRSRGVSSVITLYAIKDLKGDERTRVLGAGQ